MSEFDDLFKNRFKDLEVEVPTDMWERIQQAQAIEEDDKPVFPFWKIGVAILGIAILSIGSYFTIDTFRSNKIEVPSVVENNEIIAENHVTNDLLKSSTSSNDVLIAKNESGEKVANFAVNHTAENKLEPVSTSVVEKEIILSAGSTFDVNQKQNTNQNILTTPSSIEGIEASTSGSSVLGERIAQANSINSSFIGSMDLSPLERNNFNIQLFPEYDKKCPQFGNSIHGYFSVEAYHSSDYNLRSFTTDDEEFGSYITLREETETQRYSFSDGVKFKWHNKSGLGLGTGIERSVINEVFTFVEKDAREVKVIISIDTLFNTDGTFTTSTDTTRVELQGVRTNRINNSYTSVDIPFNVSYQYEFRKWAVGISGGIYMNVLFDQKGRILNFNNKPAWISSGAENELDIYRAKSGLKFDGAITIIYHLTPSLDIMAEPYFKYNPNSLTRVNHPLQHFNSTMGIRTGLRYNFGF